MSQTFAELGLNPDLMAGLEALGYERPSKLQADVIPQYLGGRDVVAEAPSGSGKTVAYVLPILQTLDAELEGVQIVVAVENGDEAVRVAYTFQQLSQISGLHVVPVFGGQPVARETERLGPNTTIVVGTPKRLLEHAERETIDFQQTQFVVLDSAEKLVAKKRLEQVEELLDMMPAGRQTAIFATQLNNTLQELADQFLFEPVILKRQATAVAMPLIKHRYQTITSEEKTVALARMLDGENIPRSLVYTNLRSDGELVAQTLQAQGYSAGFLHVGSESATRESLILNWRETTLDFLVLTDRAAEELMVESDYAISFDVPTDAETYAERTKLVAENGTHFSLVTARERRLLSEIETFLNQRIKAVLTPSWASVVAQRTEGFKQRLRDAINRRNLEIYMLLLNDLAEEGFDWSEIAAAAVSVVQQSQADTIFSRSPQGERRSSGPSRYRESGPPARPRSRDRERDEDREVEAGYVRLIMDAGYDIGVRPKDIVGAIANEANIPGRAVGNIDIRDRFTYVEVQEDFIDRVLTRVPSTRLRGRVVTFRRA